MATALIPIDPKLKARLTRMAKQRGHSFPLQVRTAIDLYPGFPAENEEALTELAREAKAAADRNIKRLDETNAYVNRGLKAMRNSR